MRNNQPYILEEMDVMILGNLEILEKIEKKRKTNKEKKETIIIIIINFYSPVSNTRCHSIGHKMRIARIKIRVDSPGRWERA